MKKLVCVVIMLFGRGYTRADNWVSLDVNNAKITLLRQPYTNIWMGLADLQPIVYSNVSVAVTAQLDVVYPNIQTDGTKWGIALQSSPYYTNGTVNPIVDPETYTGAITPAWYLDVPYIGSGRAIPIAVYVESPDLTVRLPWLDNQVATATLTITGGPDIISGTIPVEIIPEPASAAILTLGMFLITSKRK